MKPSKMEINSSSPKFCVFCLKEIISQNDTCRDSTKFLNIWQKFTGNKTSDLVSWQWNENGLNVCDDSSVVTAKFCAKFLEWEALLLKMDCQLKSLVSTVELAGRVPARMAKINAVSTDSFCSILKIWRNAFSNQSKRKLTKDQPNIFLERVSQEDLLLLSGFTSFIMAKQDPIHESHSPETGVLSDDFMDDDFHCDLDNPNSKSEIPEDGFAADIEQISKAKPRSPIKYRKRRSTSSMSTVDKKPKPGTPTSVKTIPCTVKTCSEKFFTEQQRNIHLTYHGTFKCRFCDTTTNYAPDLSLHETQAHGPEGPVTSKWGKVQTFRCPSCKFSCFFEKDFIRHHLKNHLGLQDITIQCSICQVPFCRPNALKKHTRECHKIDGLPESEIHRCHECPAYFTQAISLVLHKSKIHLSSKQCSICGNVFSQIKKLKSHMKVMHPERETDFGLKFGCDSCGKQYGSEFRVNLHKVKCGIQIEKKEEKQKCEECGKFYKSRRDLTKHKSYVHSKRSFVCPQCGKSCKNSQIFNRHLEYHKGPDEWKWQCAECGKKFVDRQTLKDHEPFHSKEKAFQCELCVTKFRYRNNYVHHMRDYHPHQKKKVKVLKMKLNKASTGKS